MIRIPRACLDWFDLKRSILVLVAITVGLTAIFMRARSSGGGVQDVVRAMFVALPLLVGFGAPAVIGLFAGYVRWVHERVWAPWQGRHHAFDDHPVRIIEARGRLWFASADVHAVLHLAPRPALIRRLTTAECRNDPELGRVLSNAGLVRLLGKITDRRTLRFLHWAEHDVRRIWEKRRDPGAADSSVNRASSSHA